MRYSIATRAAILLLVALVNPGHVQSAITEADLHFPLTHYAFSNLSVSQDGHYVLVSRSDTNYEWDLRNRQFVRSVPGRISRMQLAADGHHAFYPNAKTEKKTS
jgi:hypothetical protein